MRTCGKASAYYTKTRLPHDKIRSASFTVTGVGMQPNYLALFEYIHMSRIYLYCFIILFFISIYFR